LDNRSFSLRNRLIFPLARGLLYSGGKQEKEMSVHIKKEILFAELLTVSLLTGMISCSDDSNNSDDTDTGTGTATPTDGDDTDTGTGTATPTDGGDTDDAGTQEKGFVEMRSELTFDTSPNVSDADYEAFIGNMNAFGFDLFGRLIDDSSNVVFSPVSIATALGMTYAGARNNTAAEMAEVMHNDLSDEVFLAASNQLMLDLSARNIAPHKVEDGGSGEKSLQLSLVNEIWPRQGFSIESDFLDLLAVNYDSGVKTLDFAGDPDGAREIINEWVFDNTNEKIDNLLGPNAITPMTLLVLTNALYFYGSWANAFDIKDTKDATFTALDKKEVTVSMMQQSSDFFYGEKDGYKVLDIPYDGGLLSMTVVLPDAGKFSEIRDAVSRDWSEQAFKDLEITEVLLKLPKFDFTWGSAPLKEPLKALGMKDAFVPGVADFTGINPDGGLFISKVLHKAFIGVDEYGTEAAAATAVVIDYVSIPTPVSFCVDRPFLFFIRDTSGIVLFAGQVTDPS
jgi:serpin B